MDTKTRYCANCFELDQFLAEMHPIESSMVGYHECVLCGDKNSGVPIQELEKKAREQVKNGVTKLRALRSQT